MADDRALYVDRDFRAADGTIIPLSILQLRKTARSLSAPPGHPKQYLADADNRPYISGAISTWQHQQFKYGYFEA